MKTKYFFTRLSLLFILFYIFTSFVQPDPSFEASMKRGKDLYILHCQSCHMENGEGVVGITPPLAKADYMLADRSRAIKETIFGVSGKMVINGEAYYGYMPAIYIDDQETADVLTYIFNSWGNQDKPFTANEVAKVRNATH